MFTSQMPASLICDVIGYYDWFLVTSPHLHKGVPDSISQFILVWRKDDPGCVGGCICSELNMFFPGRKITLRDPWKLTAIEQMLLQLTDYVHKLRNFCELSTIFFKYDNFICPFCQHYFHSFCLFNFTHHRMCICCMY